MGKIGSWTNYHYVIDDAVITIAAFNEEEAYEKLCKTLRTSPEDFRLDTTEVDATLFAFPEEENDKENGKDKYEQFIEDMEEAGIEYEEYNGRFFYHGPAVRTNENGFPTLQDVIKTTEVRLQWDNLGSDFIVYPA